MLQIVAQLQKRLKLCDFFDFCYFGLMDKISMKSMVLVPPNIDFSSKIMIFPNFESLYLHDYWSDFKKFTYKTYLHTERRRFSIVSQRKNKNKISFESSLHREILKFQFSDLHHPIIYTKATCVYFA